MKRDSNAVGIDIAKRVFHLVGMDERGKRYCQLHAKNLYISAATRKLSRVFFFHDRLSFRHLYPVSLPHQEGVCERFFIKVTMPVGEVCCNYPQRPGTRPDLVMDLCCALHNFRVRLNPWVPMI